INGNDIMKELKIKPGPQVGKILNRIFNQVINQKVKNQRKDLIELIDSSSTITLVN
ncbi:hypothetical protein GW881_03445, partial [Candidatus Roizmanbacteria bacterium]|nr:hypothetical protein [Candidatus Roizmanbacteria bacterium]